MKENKKPDVNDPENSFGSSIYFLVSTLGRADSFSQHVDTQSNILIGVSTAIFAFAATKFGAHREFLFFDILGFFSALSAIFALLATHPPKFVRKKGQAESLMYNKKIVEFSSPAKYEHELSGIMATKEKITQQYATEIYNMYKYYYRPKRELYKISRNTLLLGIFLSFIVGTLSMVI